MSEKEDLQQAEASPSRVEELEAQISELENKRKAKQPDAVAQRIQQLEERLAQLQKTEAIAEVRDTFNNAISKEQEWDSLNSRLGTREERIRALERDTLEKLEDLRILLDTDNYQQYFFSSMNANERDEKIRRFCVHAYRMSGEEFINKYRSFIRENKYNLR